jgi:hypothetical protein
LINLQARHVQKEDHEGQARLLGASDCLVDRIAKMLDCIGFHAVFLMEAKMIDSGFVKLLRIREVREVSPESLRLLKMFTRLSSNQRRDIIERLEQYLNG